MEYLFAGIILLVGLVIGFFIGKSLANASKQTDKKVLEEQNLQLQNQKDFLENQLRSLKDEHRKEVDQLKTEREEIRTEKDFIQNDLTRTQTEFNNLQDKLKEQKAEVENLQEKFTKEFEMILPFFVLQFVFYRICSFTARKLVEKGRGGCIDSDCPYRFIRSTSRYDEYK